MDFGLSEEQQLLCNSLRRYLADACPLDTVRAIAGEGQQPASALLAGLAELGVTQALVPEAHGGLGLGVLDAALIQECLGYHAAPVPYTGRFALTALAIGSAGSEAQQQRWFAAMATAEARFCVALAEATGRRTEARVQIEAGRLQGAALFAVDAADATHVIAVDADGALQLAALDPASVAQAPLTTIDATRRLAELRFQSTPAEPLANAAADAALRRLVAVGRTLLAADTLGAATAMLEQAVRYAGERRQFGRTIASFQAVKHLCAEMAARLEPCRALVWYAAHAIDSASDQAPLLACLAKSHLSEVGQFVARTATEVHGGMGFTELAGLHYWFKRIGLNRQLLGGPARLRAEAARLQGFA